MTADRSHLYCVDGSNLVRGRASVRWSGEEDAESQHLVDVLSAVCARVGARVEVELFFDGPHRGWRSGEPNLRVRATHEEPADDAILDRVRARAFGGRGVTVVTADGELGRQAQEEGARWLRVGPTGEYEGVVRGIEARFLR